MAIAKGISKDEVQKEDAFLGQELKTSALGSWTPESVQDPSNPAPFLGDDGASGSEPPPAIGDEDPGMPIESGMPELPAVPGVPAPPPPPGAGVDPMEDASPAASGLPLSLPGSAGGSFALPGTAASLPYMRGGGGGRPPSRPSTPSPFNVGAGAPLAAPPSAAPPSAGGPGGGGGGASDDKIRAILSQFMRGRG